MTPKRPTEKEGVVEGTEKTPQRDPRTDDRDGRERPRPGEDVDGGPEPSDPRSERDTDYGPGRTDDSELGTTD